MTSIAVYVHFPFCLSICPYCDFDRQATGFDRVDAYVATLGRELEQYAHRGERVHSVFFGGGTPSLMRAEHLAFVLARLGQTFRVRPDAEVTLECNPGDADLTKLQAFRDCGATRVSFGVQSLTDAYLELLGRRHSSAQARQAAAWARRAGLDFNLDFMFGLPGQTLAQWQATLEQAIDLEPHHLSCYLLTLDDRVPMGRDVARGRLVLPADDELADMYAATQERLARAGYEQYEVSNWARPGHACRHNLTYWRNGEWIGIGAGAASAYAGRRWKNTPVLERYIQSVERHGTAERVEDEAPDRAQQLVDALALGLRLREGIGLAAFKARYGAELGEVLGQQGRWLIEAGILEVRPGGKRLPSARDGRKRLPQASRAEGKRLPLEWGDGKRLPKRRLLDGKRLPQGSHVRGKRLPQPDGARLRVAAGHQFVLSEILARLAEPIQAYARRETSRSHNATRHSRAGSRGDAAPSASSACL